MSTAVNYDSKQSTDSIQLSNEKSSYLYGHGETNAQNISELDLLTVEEPTLIKARSPLKREKIHDTSKQREDIRQVWNGTVIEFNNDELTAKLEDITNSDNPDEIIVLSIDEIEKNDRPLIQTGAMFFWHIGYRFGPKYPRERFSKISFRRLPKWTNNEIQNADKLAKEYTDFFHPDPTKPS